MATLQEVKDQLNALQAKVEAETQVDQSAIALLTNLSNIIKNSVATATDLQALKDQMTTVATTIDTNSQSLAAAVSANTPASPAPGP